MFALPLRDETALFQEPPAVDRLQATLHLDNAGRNGLASRIEASCGRASVAVATLRVHGATVPVGR